MFQHVCVKSVVLSRLHQQYVIKTTLSFTPSLQPLPASLELSYTPGCLLPSHFATGQPWLCKGFTQGTVAEEATLKPREEVSRVISSWCSAWSSAGVPQTRCWHPPGTSPRGKAHVWAANGGFLWLCCAVSEPGEAASGLRLRRRLLSAVGCTEDGEQLGDSVAQRSTA